LIEVFYLWVAGTFLQKALAESTQMFRTYILKTSLDAFDQLGRNASFRGSHAKLHKLLALKGSVLITQSLEGTSYRMVAESIWVYL